LRHNPSALQCIKETYRHEGARVFYKGYWLTMARSVIVNVVQLNVYENLHRMAYNVLE
jgi:hypothetical protein